MSQSYVPIACELHDHLEIACEHRYRLHIELTDGSQLNARAVDTTTTGSKEEFLVVVDTAGREQRLRLDRLRAIAPLDADARFGRVVLAP